MLVVEDEKNNIFKNVALNDDTPSQQAESLHRGSSKKSSKTILILLDLI